MNSVFAFTTGKEIPWEQTTTILKKRSLKQGKKLQ